MPDLSEASGNRNLGDMRPCTNILPNEDIESDDHHSENSQIDECKVDEIRIGDDSPEAMIRRENKAVKCLRITVILCLLGTAAGAATLVYFFFSRSEQNSFHNEYENLATSVLQSLVRDIYSKFQLCQTLSAAITACMKSSNTSQTNVYIDKFSVLARAQVYMALATLVTWSPFLETESEKIQFETFVNSTSNATMPLVAGQSLAEESSETCYICGSPSISFKNPDKEVILPGVNSPYTCGVIDDAARNGLVGKDNCAAVIKYLQNICICGSINSGQNAPLNFSRSMSQGIYTIRNGLPVDEFTPPPYSPIWETNKTGGFTPVMYNQLSDEFRAPTLNFVKRKGLPAITQAFLPTNGTFYNLMDDIPSSFMSVLYFPVFSPRDQNNQDVVGTIGLEFMWIYASTEIYPEQAALLDVVIENSCGQTFTLKLTTGGYANVVGTTDMHDPKYEDMVKQSSYEEYDFRRATSITNVVNTTNRYADALREDMCRYSIRVYPSQDFQDEYLTSLPVIVAVVVMSVFVFTSAVFLLYDWFVSRRQLKVMTTAKQTNAIVSSLFPQNVRRRLLEHNTTIRPHNKDNVTAKAQHTVKSPLAFSEDIKSSEPIADLFPHATVMFLDIVGFTAWSSERDPVQVFRLLETLYMGFDGLAKRFDVFKVETIGDSYVAVAGLPNPRHDHAVVMAKFADQCLRFMQSITKDLEKQLGPSTADLKARCGLHSGPVIGGVLRGEKARFQLFGDTMNTASRMESTGIPNMIQASKDTADLLRQAGKGEWVSLRNDAVNVKGKGVLDTYMVTVGKLGTHKSSTTTLSSVSDQGSDDMHVKPCENGSQHFDRWVNSTVSQDMLEVHYSRLGSQKRLVEWNCDVLYELLLRLNSVESRVESQSMSISLPSTTDQQTSNESHRCVIDEVSEVIEMPKRDYARLIHSASDVDCISSVDPRVRGELLEYVARIANMYRDVPFHNFEHASHVAMSAAKLMKRIVSQKNPSSETTGEDLALDINMYESTFGISVDHLLQFTIVFAALIHDVDHSGLSNAELVAMKSTAAVVYKEKSVAEQNSVDVAWTLLMDNDFTHLRAAIYTSQDEKQRFRQLLVNALIATDIADKELQHRRKTRWNEAFGDDSEEQSPTHYDMCKRATIVYEYIIQASDIAHTMQHFLTYKKWNEKFFRERYNAYLGGHAVNDPSKGWYQGELWFFDNYVIPLGRNLQQCGVFGACSHEYLSHALQNRREWEQVGEQIVAEMRSRVLQGATENEPSL